MKKINKKMMIIGAANICCADLIGKDIVIAGNVGAYSAALLCQKKKDVILAQLSPIIYNGALRDGVLSDMKKAYDMAVKAGAYVFYKASYGGIENALFEVGNAFDAGLDIYIKEIPITQETIEICNILDINPYKLYSADVAIIICDSGYSLAKQLNAAGIAAAACGSVTRSLDKVFVNEDVRSFITPSRGADEIYKFFENFQSEDE